jgi:hypothetical protein
MTGDADYIPWTSAPHAAAYERIHTEILSRLPGVARIHSSIASATYCSSGAPPAYALPCLLEPRRPRRRLSHPGFPRPAKGGLAAKPTRLDHGDRISKACSAHAATNADERWGISDARTWQSASHSIFPVLIA